MEKATITAHEADWSEEWVYAGNISRISGLDDSGAFVKCEKGDGVDVYHLIAGPKLEKVGVALYVIDIGGTDKVLVRPENSSGDAEFYLLAQGDFLWVKHKNAVECLKPLDAYRRVLLDT